MKITDTMKEDHFNSKTTSFEQKGSKTFLNIYCQPCLKRGLLNIPAYVNLNEFENNRYICESCSFGQTYIIALGKDFLAQKVKGVKLENRLKMRNEENEKDVNSQHNQSQKTFDPTNQHLQEPQSDQINLIQGETELEDQDQIQLTEFVKNVQINSNPETQYSLADIGMYTENIAQQYKKSLDVIDKYEEMNKAHINKWRNKLKAQFQGVMGTFGNLSVGNFLKQLRQMEEMEKLVKELQQGLKQTKAKDKIQNTDVKQRLQEKLINIKAQPKSIYLKNLIKSQQPTEPTMSQLYADSLTAYKIQQEEIALYVETLKMSGIRNLSNLKSLYNCCKGFSDAVRILISLEHKETNRRFDFITQKFKVCSIQTLYDAQMINGGYLDNRLERPPGFDVLEDQMEKKKNEEIKVKSFRKEDFCEKRKIESKVFKQAPFEVCKKYSTLPIKQFDEQEKKCQIKKSQQSQKTLPQQISLLSSQSQRQESIILSNTNDVQDESQNTKQISSSNRKNFKEETMNHKSQLQQQDDFQKVKMAKFRSKKPFESGLLNLNVMQRERANQILRMERQKQNSSMQGSQNNKIDLQNYPDEKDQSFEIDTSNENKNCPFPSLRQYYQYEKGRNLFVSKLQLTQENFQTFPPFEIYLPSVESLTIKYCPPATDPWQLLKTLKSCFRKLNELIIEEPKLGTKEMIILIAEYFPKLKSLIFRCKNEFDWELGKLFQKKMGQLVRFEVNDGEKNLM